MYKWSLHYLLISRSKENIIKYNNPGFMSKEPEYQLEEFPVGQRGDFKINNNNDGMGSNTSNI